MIHRLLCAALLALASWPALAGAPSDLVEARSGAVLKTLVAQREAFRKDPAALDAYIRSELDSLFDQEYAARLVLGRHARSQTPAQISAFADALRDNLMRKYGGALLDFDPAVSAVVRSETPLRNGQMVRVATEFQRRAGAPVPVDYMLRPAGDSWKVFDIIVEGVSYVTTYRSQFDELLRTQSIETVTRRLREGSLNAGE